MSGKKNRKKQAKRTSTGRSGHRSDTSLPSDTDPKKFKPLVRNILFLNLIALAICQMLLSSGAISENMGTVVSFIAFIGVLIALYLQLAGKGNGSKTLKSPKNP